MAGTTGRELLRHSPARKITGSRSPLTTHMQLSDFSEGYNAINCRHASAHIAKRPIKGCRQPVQTSPNSTCTAYRCPGVCRLSWYRESRTIGHLAQALLASQKISIQALGFWETGVSHFVVLFSWVRLISLLATICHVWLLRRKNGYRVVRAAASG